MYLPQSFFFFLSHLIYSSQSYLNQLNVSLEIFSGAGLSNVKIKAFSTEMGYKKVECSDHTNDTITSGITSCCNSEKELKMDTLMCIRRIKRYPPPSNSGPTTQLLRQHCQLTTTQAIGKKKIIETQFTTDTSNSTVSSRVKITQAITESSVSETQQQHRERQPRKNMYKDKPLPMQYDKTRNSPESKTKSPPTKESPYRAMAHQIEQKTMTPSNSSAPHHQGKSVRRQPEMISPEQRISELDYLRSLTVAPRGRGLTGARNSSRNREAGPASTGSLSSGGEPEC